MQKQDTRHNSFNTLEQPRKGVLDRSTAIITGSGSDFLGNEQGKGKAKFLSQQLSLLLVDVAKANNEADWEKRYWRQYHCMNRIQLHDQRVYGNYCKMRTCSLCQANRKADLINKYYPSLSLWPLPQFLTLTVKSCKRLMLNRTMDELRNDFNLVRDRIRKNYNMQIMGVYSMECNFNPIKLTYNPHLHIICPDLLTARLLREEWIRLRNAKGYGSERWITPRAQERVEIYDIERHLIETIKYGTKIFTDPEMKPKGKAGSKRNKIFVQAIHNVNKAFYRRRLFNSFGFNLPETEKLRDKEGMRMVTNSTFCMYSHEHQLWINSKTNEALINFRPSDELRFLLDLGIDLECQ